MTWLNVSGRKLPTGLKPFLKKTFYRLLPIRWRMGKNYWRLLAFLEQAQWWDKAKIEAWQLMHLKEIVDYAYINVPGYRTLLNEAGVKPDNIRSLTDISLLPFITKELLQDNIQDFTNENIPPWKRYLDTTGGSSGSPLGFYKTKTNLWVENAFTNLGWTWAGWRFGEKSSVLRGATPIRNDRFWDYDPIRLELILSSFQLSNETYQQYFEKIQSVQPKTLQAYPSTAAQLAELILSHNDQGKLSLDAVLLVAENIYPWQIEKIKRAFPHTKIAGHYGQSEQVCMGVWCENSSDYHIWPFYGVTELIDLDSEQDHQENVKEIVATSFWNKATPFIRYRTNDLAIYKSDHCEACGRQFNILSRIEGRKGDFIVGHDGDLISLTALVFGQHLRAYKQIKNLQVIQNNPGEILVRIQPGGSFSAKEESEINETFKKVSHGQLNIKIELTDYLDRTHRGKSMFLIQNIDIQPFLKNNRLQGEE